MLQVTQALKSNIQKNRNGLAVVCEGRQRTWAEFGDRVARLAAGLCAHGLKSGDRVAVIADNSDRYLEAFYAIPWAGGVIVPINTRLSAEEIAYMLGHCDVRFGFIDAPYTKLWDSARGQVQSTAQTIEMNANGQDNVIVTHAPMADAGRSGEDISGIFYTGGTTGRSKGVMLTHANHVINSLALWAGLTVEPHGVRYLHVAPMFHVADALFVYGLTVLGGCHYIIPKFDPAAFMAAVQSHQITDTILVPTMIQLVLDHPQRDSFDLTSLARLYYGAAPMPEATLVRFLKAFPKCGLVQLYGQTEAAPVLTMLSPHDHVLNGPHAHRLRSAGQAVAGCEIRVVHEQDDDVPLGTVGEIIAKSGTIMKGYWNDPAQTAAALKGGWLHTGDAGYLDEDGFVYITDRIKDMIITGGENVYSTEVERVIYQVPGVAQCAVIGVPDEKWGERVHAVIVPQNGVSLEAEAIISHCKAHIAGFKVPRSISFRDAALPVSGAGKILKRELRKEL
jgi:long-chain acyl-CoA synthetase